MHTRRNTIRKFYVVILTSLLVLSGLQVEAKPASAQPFAIGDNTDSVSPKVSNIWLSQRSIDVFDAPQKVTVSMDITDHESGVDAESVWLDPESDYGYDPIPSQRLIRTSGDDFFGRYETTFTFPEEIFPGAWYLVPTIVDKAGNRYEGVGDAHGSIGDTINVDSLADTTAPTGLGNISKTFVDVSDADVSITATGAVTDKGVGFAPRTLPSFTWGYGPSEISLSTNHEIKFSQEIRFSQATPQNDSRGTRSIYLNSVKDANGNSSASIKVGEVVVASRPFRGKRPEVKVTDGIVNLSWEPPKDTLPLEYWELEVLNETDSQ